MKLFRFSYRLATLSLALLLAPACSEKSASVESGQDIKVSKETCTNRSQRSGGPQLGASSWVNGKFIVTAMDNHYCGGSQVAEPSYVRAGDVLELQWRWQTGNQVTACMCDHTIHFEISNLPVLEYRIRLDRKE